MSPALAGRFFTTAPPGKLILGTDKYRKPFIGSHYTVLGKATDIHSLVPAVISCTSPKCLVKELKSFKERSL